MVATPGPSIIPDRVLAAMAKPMTDLYGGELVSASYAVLDKLPSLVRSSNAVPFIVVGNGHSAWQMSIANTMSEGDKVLVLESGRFAIGWGEMAAQAGVDVEVLKGSDRHAVDPEAVAQRLAEPSAKDIKAILVVQTDTASSAGNDLAAIRAAIDDAGHEALFMVDCIASLGCERFEMDAWKVDLVVGAGQKGLMIPPGVAFVWAGPRAIDTFHQTKVGSGYYDWTNRMDPQVHYQIYAGTPPIPHIHAMTEAFKLIDEEGGLEAMWHRHQVLADAVRAAIDAWSTPGGIQHNIIERAHRSNAVTTVLTGSGDPQKLAAVCQTEAGLTLGLGIGGFEKSAFRIGHMGHLNPPMILGTLGTIEAALLALGPPIGASGAAAAANVIANALTPPS